MKNLSKIFLLISIIFSVATTPCYADPSMRDAVLVTDPAELKYAGYPASATYVYRGSNGGYFELHSEQTPTAQENSLAPSP